MVAVWEEGLEGLLDGLEGELGLGNVVRMDKGGGGVWG